MHVAPNVTAILYMRNTFVFGEVGYTFSYCRVSQFGLSGMSLYSLYIYLQINYEEFTQVTFTTVTLQERSKCYTRKK